MALRCRAGDGDGTCGCVIDITYRDREGFSQGVDAPIGGAAVVDDGEGDVASAVAIGDRLVGEALPFNSGDCAACCHSAGAISFEELKEGWNRRDGVGQRLACFIRAPTRAVGEAC